jgi:hypothetical protein
VFYAKEELLGRELHEEGEVRPTGHRLQLPLHVSQGSSGDGVRERQLVERRVRGGGV